eukprot:SAG22_NODE_2585_length_2412_cov_2.092953_1_plen_126_part_00
MMLTQLTAHLQNSSSPEPPSPAAAAPAAGSEALPAVEQLTAADFEEACDCANLWFAEHADFVPFFGRGPSQVYCRENMHWHFGVRINGRLVALLNMVPRLFVVGGQVLKVAGVGARPRHTIVLKL